VFDDETRHYAVVRNDEDQYSIWPADVPPPAGWYATGTVGRKDACLSHIAEVWTDMRPASARRTSPGRPS
jgi:MbtH protein